MEDTGFPVADPDVVFVRLQGQTESAAAAAAQQADVVTQLVKHTATLARDARGCGAERKVLQQRLGSLQHEIEHLKDDLDATVGHIHAAAQQSLQFLSFNKALQTAVDELTSSLQDEKRARAQMEQQFKQLQEQVLQQDAALHQLQHHSKQQNTLLLTLQDDQLQQAKTTSEHQAHKVSSARQQQQLLALTRQLDADLRDTQKVLAQELLGLRQQVKTTMRSQARSQALYSFSKKRTEGLQDAVAQQQRDLARLQAKVSTAVSTVLRHPCPRPAPVSATAAKSTAQKETISLESSLEDLLNFTDTEGDAADAMAAVAALPTAVAPKMSLPRSAGSKLVKGRLSGSKKALGAGTSSAVKASTKGGGVVVPRSARQSSTAGRQCTVLQERDMERITSATAALAAATHEDALASLERPSRSGSGSGQLPSDWLE